MHNESFTFLHLLCRYFVVRMKFVVLYSVMDREVDGKFYYLNLFVLQIHLRLQKKLHSDMMDIIFLVRTLCFMNQKLHVLSCTMAATFLCLCLIYTVLLKVN